MDYEKKYTEALGWMQSVYPTMTGAVKEDAEHYFPELRESEDEKIRNFISNELACLRATDGKGSDRYEELTNAIAWLEKQGTSYTKKDIDDAYVEGMAFAKNELEKQKTDWSEEDERAFHHVLSVLEDYGEEHLSKSKFVCNWLKSIKARMGGDKV